MTAIQADPLLVASFPDGGGRTLLPVSAEEIVRAQTMIERMLGTFGFAHGRFVLLVSLLDNGGYAIPFERAIMNLGLLVTNADNSPYEAQRIESICRRFDVAAVVGVTGQVLDGLAGAGHDLAALFANKVVWAFPDAYDALIGVPGVILRRVIELGPGFAIECCEGAGAHIDRQEWHCDEDGGDILLTSRLRRAASFVRHRSGVRGTLVEAPCRCGHIDTRIVPEA
jgi:phenylacetate-coenzyme A ligase PaaK-like adenylate-forming protein